MSKSTPSLLALLGLVAVAGYQNRGRIRDMLTDADQASIAPRPSGEAIAAGEGSFLSEINRLFRAGTSGGTLSAGMGDLVRQMKSTGGGAQAESWVSSNPNIPIDVAELEAAIGPATLGELGRKLGLSRAALLLRLAPALPEVINRFTPDGRMPTEAEAERLV